jgi:hypothetical protein
MITAITPSKSRTGKIKKNILIATITPHTALYKSTIIIMNYFFLNIPVTIFLRRFLRKGKVVKTVQFKDISIYLLRLKTLKVR